jgi:hypothetical protein
VEYYQGRVGGIVTRGGDYTTEPERVRSSARDEFSLYNADDGFKPRHLESLGIRLALASPIFTNALAMKKMAAEWDSYRSQRAVPSIASPSAPNRAAQVAGRINGLNDRLQKLKAQMDKAGAGAEIKDMVALAVSDAQNITADANAVEGLLATTLAESAYTHGNALGASLFSAKVQLENSQDPALADSRDMFIGRAKIAQATADIQATKYCEDVRRMGTTNAAALDAAFTSIIEKESKIDVSKRSENHKELQVLKLILTHVTQYRDNPRVDESKYRSELLKIFDVPSP